MELYKSKYSDGKTDGRNSRRDNDSSRSFRNSGDRRSRDDREDTEVTCADCGNQCTVPFVPRSNKPVYCSDCFRNNKPEDSGRDRYSRDDRGSRSSGRRESNRDDRSSRSSGRRESNRDDRRSRSPKSDKLSKRKESFFTNGSDKFYATIKEKLFEILGGKTCSSCGFKDERALGIRPIADDADFDSNGRGGEASSWGKYISSPDLAREDLHVLCLNCNEIRQPVSKPKEESRPKSKKSKYFPR
jgi:CxxC-x17-CxxC domain-containing protein